MSVVTLTLKNFRCWENKTFTFNDNGIILVSGISGKGKSTILNAILYIITGSLKNVTTFGKEKSNMEAVLTIKDLVITRGKNPTRFTVKQGMRVYEEDQAQSIINNYFGSDFKHISYIDQDNSNSFVYLSPESKMTFLRNLLLSSEPIDEMKEKIKTKMDICKKELITEDTTITTTTSFLRTLQYNEHSCKIGKRLVTSDNYTDTIDTQCANCDTSKKNRLKLVAKCAVLEKEYKTHIEQSTRLSKVVEIKDELAVYDIQKLSAKREHLLEQKKIYETHTKYIDDYKVYVNQKSEFDKLSLVLSEFRPETYKSIPLLEQLLKLYQSICSLDSQIGEEKEEELKNTKDQLTNDIKHIQRVLDQEHVYDCPSCQTPLKMNNGKLTKVNAFVKESEKLSIDDLLIKQKQFDRVQKEIILLERATLEYNDNFDKFETLIQDTAYDTETNFPERIATLKKDERAFTIAMTTFTTLEKKINSFVCRDEIPPVNNDTYTLLEQLATINESIKRYNDLQQRLTSLQINGLILNDDPSESIIETKQKIIEYEQKIEVYTSSISQLQEWKRVNDTNEKYTELSKSVERSKDAKAYLMDELKCYEKLTYYVKDAETRSIHQFIDSLNKHAELYIEDFFPDEDIRVELVTNKELKSGKDKLGLFFDVHYKTIKGDIDFLSGGQRDRVNLAFTLAFSELVQNQILLLDECISSLDSETSDTVIDTLKEKYKGKLVICVAHQVNTGVFDQVVVV